jgi:hypothetical protein
LLVTAAIRRQYNAGQRQLCVTAGGNPDPIPPNTSPAAALLGIAMLVFREGLECILVLTAITASILAAKAYCSKAQ